MDIQLTPAEIQELRRIQKKEKYNRRRFVQATVLLMLHRGLSIEKICASLSLDESTIYHCAKAFQEMLWRLLKKEVINPMYYDTYSKFRDSIIHFLEIIKDYKEEVRSLLTLNFRTVGNASVYFS